MSVPINDGLRVLSGTQLMQLVREITGSAIDPQTRARIAELERAGSNVTVFEVIEDDAILILAHAAERPNITMIRRAYEQHIGAEGGVA